MTNKAAKTADTPFTHTAYFFIRTGARKGRVIGYWKDGGRFKATDGGNYFAFADMLPRGGWDGRIRFVKFGDPPPGDAAAAQRPGAEDGGEAEGEEGSEF